MTNLAMGGDYCQKCNYIFSHKKLYWKGCKVGGAGGGVYDRLRKKWTITVTKSTHYCFTVHLLIVSLILVSCSSAHCNGKLMSRQRGMVSYALIIDTPHYPTPG